MLRARILSTCSIAALFASGASVYAQDSIEGPGPAAEEVTISPQNDDVSTMTSDEIFRRMFGKEPPPVGQNKYTVLIDGINTGTATIDPGDGWIESDFLEREVLPLLLPEPAERLRPLLQQPRVSFLELQQLTYTANFDSGDLVLVLEIPFELRDERIILLGGRPRDTVADVIPPANISAFLNIRAGVDWIQQSPFDDTGVSGFVADFDGAINVGGVVLEGEFRYDEEANRKFTRGDIRAVYDDLDSLIRFEAGDLSIGRRPYQNAPTMAGIAAYREFRIDPYSDPRPVGERGIVLERPAKVEVIVNGSSVRQVSLPAGRYSLRDFPITAGAINDVEFIITYGSGEVERLTFPAFTSIDLLGEGTSEFALNVGVPYDDDRGIRRYDTNDFNVIGFYRRGFTPTLTAGASVEANKDILLVGAEAAWASPFGNLGVQVWNDLRNPGLDSGRLALQYNRQSPDPYTGTAIDALVILTGDEYRTLDQLFGEAPDKVYASTRITRALGTNTRLQLGGNYRISSERDVNGDRIEAWTLSANVGRSFGRVSANLGVDYTNSSAVGSEVIARVGIFVPLGSGTLTSSYTTRENTFRAGYRRSPRTGVGGFGYNADFQVSDQGNQQSIGASYFGNRFEFDIEQSRTASNGSSDLRTGAVLGTALVMADGDFAISRPVTNSFAIVKNGSEIEAKLALDPRGAILGGQPVYSAYSDFMGPGVVPDLNAYFYRQIEVEVPDAEAGTGLNGELFYVKPRYKSGYSLSVGTGGGTVSALGNLMFEDGTPVSMISGTVKRLDAEPGDPAKANDDEPDASFFTNSGGRFFIEGLDPSGEYEVLIVINDNPQRFVLTVPDDAFGIWNIDQPIKIEGGDDESGSN